jgi:serine phosphatase RsbU (regulator of sigma subunit)/pSer/pThr/pTyr-binding forkhead associated (FHA) protein
LFTDQYFLSETVMPHLFVEQGRIKGTQFPLGADRTVIGRDKACDVCLPEDKQDPKISRRHAVISFADGRYYIKDGDGDSRPSRNTTRVNHQLLTLPGKKLLKDRDVIEICSYVLVFRDDVPQPEIDSPSTVILAIGEEESGSVVQPAEKLKEITNLLRHSLELDALLPRVVECLLEIFRRADRSFVILRNPATGDIDHVRIFKTRREEPGPQRPFSRKIVQQCLLTKKAQRSSDQALLRSAMCAPLWSGKGEPFGVLLLDNHGSTKGFSLEDVVLLEGVANHASTAFAIAWYHDQKVKLAEMEQELTLAADVVKRFLPERLPEVPGYEFFAAYEPVVAVGGDYYDFVPLAGNKLAILVADVAGHGWPAAVVMARFSAQVQACLRAESDLAKAVGILNTLAQPLGMIEKFITLAVVLLDPLTHAVTLVNAGHPPPLMRQHATGGVEEMNLPTGHEPMLAAWDDYAYSAQQFMLQPGDTVIVYSDGIDAAMHDEGLRPFGTKGLRAILKGLTAAPRELGEHILRAWDKHAAGCRPHDDITVVCFGRTQ